MKVKIIQPAKSAMQSGKGRHKKKWILTPIDEEKSHFINPLNGWTSVNNTLSQLKISFATKEQAIEYAKSKNFAFEVIEPKSATLKSKSYASNFIK